MKILNKLSLYTKILIIILLITFSVAAFSVIVFIKNDLPQIRNMFNLFSEVTSQSSAISSALIDGNIALVNEKVDLLRLNPNISSVEIYLYDGNTYHKVANPNNEKNMTQEPRDISATKSIFSLVDQQFELMIPVIKQEKPFGAIQIRTINESSYLHSVFEMIILISLLSIFLAMLLSELITKPLLKLVNAMKQVTTQNDYSVRISEDSDDEVGTLVKSFNGMLETIQQHEKSQRASLAEIKRLAYYDSLTGLPNRDLFNELLRQLLIEAKRNDQSVAIFYIDLDNFKAINDYLGNDNGDVYLQNIVSEFAACVQSSSKNNLLVGNLARLNADKFVVTLQNFNSLQDVELIANTFIAAAKKSFTINGKQVSTSASVGVSIYPQHGLDSETLINYAETAMGISKEDKRGCYQLFDNKQGKLHATKIKLEQDLHSALVNKELTAYFQPKYNLRDKKINGAELLLRWIHPELGMISPDIFIPIAENSDLITDIGEWVILEGCKQCRIWHLNGYPNLHVSVNLSPRQFVDTQLIDKVTRALSATGLAPEHLELELTEGTIMMSDDKTLKTLHALKDIGIKLSIDDFGTGYSSLRYLARYPVDTIKIDKSFITYLIENKNNATITKTIIDLAHNLNLNVIAEGVETVAQLNYLHKNDCDAIQGYFISKPLPADDLISFLSNRELQDETGT